MSVNQRWNPLRAPSAEETAAMRECFSLCRSFFLPVDGHTQEGLLVSIARIALCQACSSSHTQDTHERRRTGAYHTLNKRGRIPDVFPHEVTSCSRGRAGCWESTGGSAEKDASSAEGLIGTVYVFHHSPSHPSVSDFIIFISRSISAPIPPPPIPSPPPSRSLFPLLSHPSRRDCEVGSETFL